MVLAIGGVAIRRIGAREGREREETQATMLKLAQSSISGIREVKIAGVADVFLDRFSAAARRHGNAVTVIGWMQVMPRVVIEAIAILVVLGVFFHASRLGTESRTLPLLAVYLAAGYRLLPSLNRLYVSGLMIHYAWAGFRAVVPGLSEAVAATRPARTPPEASQGRILEATGIGFSYPGSGVPVLDGASAVVRRGEMVRW
jgi:ATP-binding cassette subfamily C protein